MIKNVSGEAAEVLVLLLSPCAQVFAWFVDKCRANLHIVLCLSPIGAAFRNRLRNYPSLFNCCTIDWSRTALVLTATISGRRSRNHANFGS